MHKRLLIIDGESDSGGPNVTVGQAQAAVGHLFGEIQRLEFRHTQQLVADLPKYQADRVMTAGHGGLDGPNARSSLVHAAKMTVTPLSIVIDAETQDQLTTTERIKASYFGATLLSQVNEEILGPFEVDPLVPGVYDDAQRIVEVYEAISFLVEGIEGITTVYDDSGEPTSNTDNLPSFGEFCRALASCVSAPAAQQGHALEPYFYVGSCYSRAQWDAAELPRPIEPASFVAAVAGLSGVPTFGNVDGTSVSASLENIKRIETAIEATGTGKVPGNVKLQDGVKLVR